MTILTQSRILKAFADRREVSFEDALQRLVSVRLVIMIGLDALITPAGQACLLSAAAVARKTYVNVTVVLPSDVSLLRPLPHAFTAAAAVRAVGANVASSGTSIDYTHAISIGTIATGEDRFWACCYWDGWLAGVSAPWEAEDLGESWNPIAGAFAGALAVRETFTRVMEGFRPAARRAYIDLWNLGTPTDAREPGPSTIYLPKDLLLIGLGHLGQGFLWNLMLLPGHGEILALQDYQRAAHENVGTGILTALADVGKRKTSIAAEFCNMYGWDAAILDAPFSADSPLLRDVVGVAISGLDAVKPREWIRKSLYPYMVDIGVGHGPVDFEIGQLRVLPAGAESTWTDKEDLKDSVALRDSAAYADQKRRDPCGALALAQASVAVPFVGLAMGAIALTQVLRLGAMQTTTALIQIELSSPEFAASGTVLPKPARALGVREIDLLRRTSGIG